MRTATITQLGLFELSVFGLSSLCWSGTILAADVSATTRIDKVTVYAQGAMVTRTGTVNLSAGSQRIVVSGLPAGLDRSLLRVTVGSASVRLGSVDVNTVNEGQYAAAKERELRAQLETKSDARAVIQDDIDTAQTQLKLLESLAANPTGGATGGPAVSGATLSAVLSNVGTSAAAARTRIRDAKLKQRAIDRQIDTLKAELAKISTAQKQSTEVAAAVEVAAAGNVPVTVSYRVDDAAWRWVYQARLDTTAKKLSLERQGEVTQGSGEDWSTVQLTLTTAQPEDDVSTPVVNSEFLDLYVPRPVVAMARRDLAEQSMAMAAPAQELQKTSVAIQKNYASAAATQYLVEYQVPNRVSLSADRQQRLFPISDEQFDTQLVARVMPSESRRAHLEATFKYELDTPIEAGELQLYRDGAYVGTAETDAFLPGAEVRMPFGVDERIKVAVRDEATKSDQSTVFGKQISKETKQRFEITSYHASALSVEVMDRVPVSKNNDIKVEVIKGATEPTAKDVDGKAGVYQWRFMAEPQKLTTIRHYYSVKYPKDRQLESSEE